MYPQGAPAAGPIRIRGGGGLELEVEGAFVKLPEADVPCEGAWLEAEAQALVTLHAAAARSAGDAAQALREDWLGLAELPGLTLTEVEATTKPGVALRRGRLTAEDGLEPLELAIVAVVHKGVFFGFLVRADQPSAGLTALVGRLVDALGRLASGEPVSRIVAPRGGLVDPTGRPAASGLVDPSGRPASSGLVDPSGRPLAPPRAEPARPSTPYTGPRVAPTDAGASWACPALSIVVPIPEALQLVQAQLDSATFASTSAPGILLVHAGLYEDPRDALAALPARLGETGLQLQVTAPVEATPAGLLTTRLTGRSPEGELGVVAFGRACETGATVVAIAVTSAAKLSEAAPLAEAIAAGARFGKLRPHPEAQRLFVGAWSHHRGGSQGTLTGAAGGASTSSTASLRFQEAGTYALEAESSFSALSAASGGAQALGQGGGRRSEAGRWFVSHGLLVRSSREHGSRISQVQCDGERMILDGLTWAR